MSSRQMKEKNRQLVFSEVCLKLLQVICWSISCLKFVLSWLHSRILPILVPSQAGVFQ